VRVIVDEYIVKCPTCDIKLALNPSDVEDDNAVGTWCFCPVCHRRVPLLRKNMPLVFQKQVDWDEP
jgi:hypothetical protein